MTQTGEELLRRIDKTRLPRHIAIIMDGNGRWAKERGLPRLMGHKSGTDSVKDIVRTCGELGVEVLTLYAFSTENWLRPEQEVSGLMSLLVKTLDKETQSLDKNNVRLRAVGRLDKLPESVRGALNQSIATLQKNTGLILNLALNYGGRQEIVDAVNACLAAKEKTIDVQSIERHLYTAGLPDPDLVIRTSGESRLSNFLLWQSAYAEIYVSPVYWPSFRKANLFQAVLDYQTRERRFGGL